MAKETSKYREQTWICPADRNSSYLPQPGGTLQTGDTEHCATLYINGLADFRGQTAMFSITGLIKILRFCLPGSFLSFSWL